ncbi:MAG: FAD-dependent oxidoreductase, partial [Rhodospirillales bacterium]|nr:FAD-dependent oxidoreductase [Rhodospirillales bacterium]
MSDNSNDNGIVIIGSGMAGYTLAREFRKLDKVTPLTIVTADDGAVYSKPMLSNALAQNKTAETLVQKDASAAAAEMGVTVRIHTSVVGIERDQKKIRLMSNKGEETLSYQSLVLATGATPRPYSAPGTDAVPVATVNGLDDYRRWRSKLNGGDRVLLIGAGLIGVEFANDMALAGHQVTLVDPAPQPLGRLLPEALGGLLADALGQAGIDVICGHTVTKIESVGSHAIAEIDDGRRIDFDRALSAIGLIANTTLAKNAGLTVDQGIVVDALMRTSDPDIYALGDCAQTDAGMLPFILPLMAEARALAKTLAGEETALHLSALPVVVKTPALPVVVCPPKPGAEGAWVVEGEGNDRRAVFTA